MTDLQKLSEDFKDYILSSPDSSMALGDTRHLGQLGDPSLEAAEQRLQRALALLQQLDSEQSSDFDEQLNLELMQRTLKREIFFAQLTQHGQAQRRRKPQGIGGISEGIFQLFVNDEREPASRLDNILSRLLQAPGYLAVEIEVITEPIRRWRDIEVQQGQGIAELFSAIVNWAVEENYKDIAELEAAVENCNDSVKEYLTFLQAAPCIDDFSIGEEKVLELLAIRQIYRSPKELVAMASDFMQRTQSLLADLTEKLTSKYQLPQHTTEKELHEFLNHKFAAKIEGEDLSSVLQYYYREVENINHFINERQLFSLPAQQSMTIMQTPGFLQPVIPAGAMWPPLALREGTKTSLVLLTLKQDQLEEHTELGIPVMMIHEGIPGHHLQFSTAAGHSAFIRRIFSANEHAEGWTTMLEDYMLDMGYIDEALTDEVRFIAKRDISRLVARVGIDLYFMTANKDYLNVGLDLQFNSDDVFENAAKLLKEATGFSDGRVQAELNWYSTEQGYPLSYLTGNQLVWQLKKDLQEANTKNLTPLQLDQAFHRVYLESGCMPVESLRKVFVHLGYL